MGEMLNNAARRIHSEGGPETFRNRFHYDVPCGWLNDPNGPVVFRNEYHVFYQWNPYAAADGCKYWGHVKTRDFIHWETLPPAIAPDEKYDENGCWSGGAISVDDSLYIMYTGNLYGEQHQCLAVSRDGIYFEKVQENPVIPLSQLPSDSVAHSFRDPCLIEKDGHYYVLLGNKDVRKDCGRVILYESLDLKHWKYRGPLLEDYSMNDPGICECPSYSCVDGKDILLTSRNCMPTRGCNFRNFADVVAYIGTLDFSSARFEHSDFQLLDYGFDYYAAQFLNLKDRSILTAWLQMWEVTYPTQELGWVGTLSFPREVRLVNNKLYQKPVKELQNYCALYKEGKLSSGVLELPQDCYRIQLEVEGEVGFGIEIAGDGGSICCEYSSEEHCVTMSREGNIARSNTPLENNTTERIWKCGQNVRSFDVLIDVSTLEVFFNDGEATMSSNYYIQKGRIKLFTSDRMNYKVYRINV